MLVFLFPESVLMRFFSFAVLSVILQLTIAGAAPVCAQEALLPATPKRSTIWGERIDLALLQAARNPALQSVLYGTVPSAAAAPADWKYEFAATDFTPVAVRDVPERLAGNLSDPVKRDTALRFGRDILAGVESSLEFRRNNLAYAMALSITACLRLTELREFSVDEEARVLRIVNDALASSPAFRESTSAERTLAYDAFIVTAGMISRMGDDAIADHDRELASNARILAQETLASFGRRK
ncbi:MAG: hypothetical protein IPF83_00310 [Rhodanobacteraceae bacterium]|nr:hypothetical protein [Rhodanobacteraceae bacterium]MBK7042868.1 hypothetical protein [Rhodanobacteraceae bacterium]HQW80237.1 hypothetical protein [Pseudomonadota bacterium]